MNKYTLICGLGVLYHVIGTDVLFCKMIQISIVF